MKSESLTRLRKGPSGRALSVLTTIALTGAFLAAGPAFAATAAEHAVPYVGKPVPGATQSDLAAPDPAAADSSQTDTITPADLPAPGAYNVSLPADAPTTSFTTRPVGQAGSATTTTGSWVQLGTTGINIAAATPASTAQDNASAAKSSTGTPVGSVSATIVDPATAAQYGPTSMALRLARSDNNNAGAPVAVRIPNTLLAGLHGADFDARTR